MDFASHYVLEDPLLTTVVETFKAADRRTHHRVLVHVFPAAEQRLAPASSSDEVKQRFVELTAARVPLLDAGVDPVTGYAFAVTEEIASDIIAGWGSSSAPTRITASEFSTAEFLRGAGPTAAPPAQPASAQPGEFTREFMSFGAPASPDPEPKRDSPAPAAGPKRGPGAFTRMFFGSPGGVPSATEPSLPEVPRQVKERPQAGAFTRMFGQPVAPASREPQPQAPGAFTRMFQASRSPKAEPADSAALPVSPEPMPSAFPRREAAPAVQPAKPSPAASAASAAPRSPATRLFSGDIQQVHPPAALAGPSEYTKVISSPFAAPCPSAPLPPAPSSPPPAAPVFGGPPPAPPLPQGQADPGMPAYPAAPPPAPPSAAPQVPQPAPQPSVAPLLRAWMPLIILLNVLFLIAILLIVVFALKGR